MNIHDLMAFYPLVGIFLGWIFAGLVAGLVLAALPRLFPAPARLMLRAKLAMLVLGSQLRRRLRLGRRNPYFRIVDGGDG